MKHKSIIICLVIASFFSSCDQKPFPLAYGYYRIDLPESRYQTYTSDLPYAFDLSNYATVKPSSENEPNWINIEYPQWNATIHCSYKKLTTSDLMTAIEDSRTLAYKHTIRAEAISEEYFEDPEHKVYGVLYQIAGNAASSAQFFVTDSTHHFLRGSLYFNHLPNADSIAPVNAFITNDISQIMETLTWK